MINQPNIFLASCIFYSIYVMRDELAIWLADSVFYLILVIHKTFIDTLI